MRAMRFERYGSPDRLKLVDVPTPVPDDHEVLVRVRAASINSWDWDLLAGTFQGRLGFMAWRKPRFEILGADVAGVVESVGGRVHDLQVGDEVYGEISQHGWGGFAEYVVVPARVLTEKPRRMTFEQAAVTPQAGLLALQALEVAGRMQPGCRVLINGAGGGVGTFAIQIAKSLGAAVTGIDHADKFAAMRSIGVDGVIDYTEHDFTTAGERYDVIIDPVAAHPVRAYRRALDVNGVAVIVGGSMRALLGAAAFGRLAMTKGRSVRVLAFKPRREDLARLSQLIDSGDVIPVIGHRYPLDSLPEAFRRYARGEFTGKIVVTP